MKKLFFKYLYFFLLLFLLSFTLTQQKQKDKPKVYEENTNPLITKQEFINFYNQFFVEGNSMH